MWERAHEGSCEGSRKSWVQGTPEISISEAWFSSEVINAGCHIWPGNSSPIQCRHESTCLCIHSTWPSICGLCLTYNLLIWHCQHRSHFIDMLFIFIFLFWGLLIVSFLFFWGVCDCLLSWKALYSLSHSTYPFVRLSPCSGPSDLSIPAPQSSGFRQDQLYRVCYIGSKFQPGLL